jgi:GAF domain-containing protein
MTPAPFSSGLFCPPTLAADIRPLISALTRGTAVAYVGAGPSIAAGLPSWQEFLAQCLNHARYSSAKDPKDWEVTRRILLHGDYLTTAELLQMALGPQLEQYIYDVFTKVTRPSTIHYAIARLPFALVITSNYDSLLENAYAHRPGVRTWRQADAFFGAVKNERLAIIKTHGDVGDGSSLVLTKTQYRDLVNMNEAFNSCLRTLLSLRTFLFVGTSLRDHDLLSLMDEARLTFGADFGPHYAILFEDEINFDFVAYLRSTYAIHVLTCRPSPSATVGNSLGDGREQVVTQMLNEIGGHAAVAARARHQRPGLNDPLFSKAEASATLLREAIDVTGSFRGEVCLLQDATLQAVHRVATYPVTVPSPSSQIEPDSVIGRLFLKRKLDDDFVYLSDVAHAQELLTRQGFCDARYRGIHTDVKSELACPVYSDGRRVGVVNVEATLVNAYTREHMLALRQVAEQIGWVYYEASQRAESASRMRPYLVDFKRFATLMGKSRLLVSHHMKYILYEIDYANGRLRAHADEPSTRSGNEPFEYGFHDASLATTILRERSRRVILSADDDLRTSGGVLAAAGAKRFNIYGSVVAMPIVSGAHMAAVLVAWTNKDAKGRITRRKVERLGERVHRMAHLIANDPALYGAEAGRPESAGAFIDHVNKALYPYDHGEDWNEQQLRDPQFREAVIEVMMEALTHPSCNVRRVRLWVIDVERKDRYKCYRSFTRADATVAGKPQWDAYRGICGHSDDPYVKYTVARFEHDPYARHQHESMFGEPDTNAAVLDKDGTKSWIVGPITPGHVLWGYLSADGQGPEDETERMGPPAVMSSTIQAYQRYAVDLITDVLLPVVVFELAASNQRNREVEKASDVAGEHHPFK